MQRVSEQLLPEQFDFEQFDKHEVGQFVVFVWLEQFVVTQLVPVQFLIVQLEEEHDEFEPQVVLQTVFVQFVPEQLVLVQF